MKITLPRVADRFGRWFVQLTSGAARRGRQRVVESPAAACRCRPVQPCLRRASLRPAHTTTQPPPAALPARGCLPVCLPRIHRRPAPGDATTNTPPALTVASPLYKSTPAAPASAAATAEAPAGSGPAPNNDLPTPPPDNALGRRPGAGEGGVTGVRPHRQSPATGGCPDCVPTPRLGHADRVTD